MTRTGIRGKVALVKSPRVAPVSRKKQSILTGRICAYLLRRACAMGLPLVCLHLGLEVTKGSQLTWDIVAGNGTLITPGAGTWTNGSGNWNNGGADTTWSNATPDSAIFSGTGGTVALGSAITAGGLTFTGSGYTISGNILTLAGASPTITVANNGDSATIGSTLAGSAGFTKTGAGTLTLSGATNTYTGDTVVNGGTLILNYGQNNNKLADGGALKLGGATITLTGGSHTEIVASTELTSGGNSITRSTVSSTLRLNAITRNAGTTLSIGAASIATTDTTNTNGILGAWATVAGADWAINSTNGNDGAITAYTAYIDLTRQSSGTKVIADGATTNVRIIEGTGGAAANLTLASGTTTINTLNQSLSGGTAAATVDIGTGNTLAVNGILVGSGAGALTVGTSVAAGGTLTGAGSELIVTSFSANVSTINSAIANNAGSVGLTKGGTGTIILTGANTYTGATNIGMGTLRFSNRVSFYNADKTSWTADNFVVSGGAAAAFNVGGSGQFLATDLDTILGLGTATGGFRSGSYLGLDTTGGSFAYASVIANPNGGANVLGLIKTGGNTLTLSGVNSYTGGTTVNGGAITVNNDQSAAAGGWRLNGGSASFSSTSTIAVAAGRSIYVGDMNAVDNNLTVTGTVNNGGTLQIGYRGYMTLNAGANWTQSGGMTLAPATTTSYYAMLTMNGGAFTYTGATAIVMNTSAGGSRATFTLNGGTFTTAQGFVKSAGNVAPSDITMNGGTIRLSADIAQLANLTGGTAALTFNLGNNGGTIDTNGFNATLNRDIVNVASQNGALTKTGAGTLTLSGASTYTGSTKVNGGALLVSGSLIGTQVQVNDGGTFGGTGGVTTSDKTFTLASGAKLDPGTNGSTGLSVNTGASSLDISLGVTGSNSGALLFNLDTEGASDKITLTVGTLAIGDRELNFADFAFTAGGGFGLGTYTLFSLDDINATLNGALAESGLSGTIGSFDATLGISGNDIVLQVVPEPGAAISLLGGLGLLLGLQRRRRPSKR